MNWTKFFAGWLVIFGTLALLVAPFVWGGAYVGFFVLFLLTPRIFLALIKR